MISLGRAKISSIAVVLIIVPASAAEALEAVKLCLMRQ